MVTHITNLTDSYDNFPLWSPHGDTMAFIRRVGRNFNVFHNPPDGTRPGAALHHPRQRRSPRLVAGWQPHPLHQRSHGFKDEALLTGNPQPYGEIFVMNADGTHIEQLTDNQWEDGGPAWQSAKPTPSTATVAVH